MSEFIQMTTTTDSRELARQIADTLVMEKLAACVQVSGPVTSVYEWKNKMETTEEWCCVIRTRKDFSLKVEERIKALHHYEVPEIVILPMSGSRDYLDWITGVTVS
ncbi:MAG: divalent-cation tolerance protein CutA [bacterium]|nr:divalent-cation tolerance protein CutA [bacterium]